MTSERKWTKGPWFTRNIGEKENCYVVGVAWAYDDESCTNVADPEPWHNDNGDERFYSEAVCFVEYGTLSDGYMHANARLIAAAPNMAEALEGLLRRYDPENAGAAFEPDGGCIECTVGTVPNHLNTGLCPYHKAIVALAKARGEQS